MSLSPWQFPRFRKNRSASASLPHVVQENAAGKKLVCIVVVALIALSSPLHVMGQQDLQYETIRFYTKNSKPEQILSYGFSPDGRYLAVSFNSRNLGARSGATIIDLQQKELVRSVGNFSFFTLAFSSDSRSLLGVGGYAGIQRIDVPTGSIQRYRNIRDTPGKIGMDIGEKNGKLLVTRITEGFNPTIDDQIHVGDEILAINEGEKPTLYNDSREWRLLAGKPRSKALESMSGKPGTWVQLRLVRRGSSTPIEVSVQRQWPPNSQRTLPKNGKSLTQAISRGVFQFRSADTLQVSAYTNLRDIRREGQHAISPDGKRFAAISRVMNGRAFCVEVHSLESGKLEKSANLDTSNYRYIRFAPDSDQVLVGTRDTIEIFDIESDEWKKPVVLTQPEDADGGRTVTRRIPLGLGFPGDLYTTTREVVYAKPAALSLFDVAPDGTLAVASETGQIVLASLKSKERAGLVGDNLLGARPEMIEFSPTGQHLVAFAKGVLHIVDIKNKNEQLTSTK